MWHQIILNYSWWTLRWEDVLAMHNWVIAHRSPPNSGGPLWTFIYLRQFALLQFISLSINFITEKWCKNMYKQHLHQIYTFCKHTMFLLKVYSLNWLTEFQLHFNHQGLQTEAIFMHPVDIVLYFLFYREQLLSLSFLL